MSDADRDVFLSRAGEDSAVALVIAKILNDAGYSTWLQDHDFGSAAFTDQMNRGFAMVDRGAKLVALYSSAYLAKDYCLKEAEYALVGDARNQRQRLLPFRIAACAPQGMLKEIPYVDLVLLLHDLTALRAAVLGAIDPQKYPKEADFSALNRLAPTQTLHPEIRAQPSFTGRTDELAALDKALAGPTAARAALTNSQAATAAVKGLGGVGKSVLARQWAWDNRDRYHGVWWLRAENPSTVLDDLIELGTRIVSPSLRDMPDRRAAARLVLDAIEQRTTLTPHPVSRNGRDAPQRDGHIRDLHPSPSGLEPHAVKVPDPRGAAAPVAVRDNGGERDAPLSPHPVSRNGRDAPQRDGHIRDLHPSPSELEPHAVKVPDPRAAAAAVAVRDDGGESDTGKPWLLIYDNVERPDAIRDLIPRDGAHALLTTRWQDWYGEATEIPIGVFSRDTAVAYLMERARGSAERPDETRAAAGRLADDLGCLPLALAIARAQAWGMNWSFDRYREHIGDMLGRKPTGAVDYPASVFATFTSALDRAIATAPEAEKLLALCAFLAPDDIPLDLFNAKVKPEIAKGDAVAALGEVSLVTSVTLADGSPAISVHRLLLRVMRDRLGERASNVAAEATAVMARAYPSGTNPEDVRAWPRCAQLEAHAVAVLDHAPDKGDAAADTSLLLNQFALHLNARADYAKAEPLMRRALAIDEASYGPDHPEVAIRLNNLAQLLQATNRHAEAEPLMRRALASDEASYGPDHPTVAIRLNNLAHLLQATNRLAEAEPLMRRALAIDEASYGQDHPSVARDLNNLAFLLQDTNRLAEAEPLMRRAAQIFAASLGDDHPNTVTVRDNLADLEAALASLSPSSRGEGEGEGQKPSAAQAKAQTPTPPSAPEPSWWRRLLSRR